MSDSIGLTPPARAEQILSVRYAGRTVRPSEVLYNYAADELPDGDLEMDYNFWIIRAVDGITLFDTGYDVSSYDWLGEIPGTSTPECLRLLEIDPNEVMRVVTSHFHYDHIGYLGLFPNAEIVCARAEYDYWTSLRDSAGLDGEFTTAKDLALVEQAHDQGRLTQIDQATRIAEHLTAVPVGGHSPGEMFLVVGASERPVILAADAAHFEVQLEKEWPFFAFTDLKQMQDALSQLNMLGQALDAAVVPGHDARTRAHFPPLAGPAEHVVTVLA